MRIFLGKHSYSLISSIAVARLFLSRSNASVQTNESNVRFCGEFWPGDEMYEPEDGRICCPDCLEKLTADETG